MEVLFENSFSRDAEYAKEVYQTLFFKRPGGKVIGVLLLLYFVFGIYNVIDSWFTDWLLLIIWCLMAAFVAILINNNKRTAIKRDLEIHGKPVDVTMLIFEDSGKLLLSTGSETMLYFENIKKVVQTQKYIHLITKSNLLYSLKKDAFTIGNAEAFLDFLKSKGIKV